MKKIKCLFNNLDKTDLKIMKIGMKICFAILMISIMLLCIYLLFIHNLFLYKLGLSIFRLSTYFAIEFIICGIIADIVKKQLE